MSEQHERAERRRQLLLRAALLLVLAGGLGLWAHLRSPRELLLDVDLTASLPGELAEVDVTVRRDGHLLARHDEPYGPQGGPATVHLQVRARPGAAEVETVLVDRAHRARRALATVELREGAAATVTPR